MAAQRDKVIASAEKLVARGKIEPAIKEYERLLDDNPNDVNTLNRIGDLWVRINRTDEAVKVFTRIADHYSKDGFFLKAIAIYKKINKLDPSKLDIYAKLADLYARQGLAMEAKSQYQVLADYYLKHSDPGNALVIYRKISELDPNSINVHAKLADLYAQNGQTPEALKEYERVGRMLLKRGMLDEAVQVFRKALKIDPKNVELVDSLVTSLLEARDVAKAQQVIDTALEINPNEPRLLAMLGRIQLSSGDVGRAKETLERALASNSEDASVRETLADLYLRLNNPDRALEMVNPLVERALGRGERGAAIEMLTRIQKTDAAHAPTLERLVTVYIRLNEETNILTAMNSLAEAHIGKGRYDEATKVIERLIQREPQNLQHRTKLEFVSSQMSGVDTLPVKGKAAPPPPMEIDEPAPSFAPAEEVETSISLDLDDSEALDLDLGSRPATSGGQLRAPSQHLMPAVEIAAADLASENEHIDFVTEHLTEAEVFAKYGLAEKAEEHLRAVLERAPKNLTAHDRLFRVLLEDGEVDAAKTAAAAYIAILEENGSSAEIDTVRNEFTMRGHSFGGPSVSRFEEPVVEEVDPVPSPDRDTGISFDDISTSDDEITFDLTDDSGEISFDLHTPPETPPAETAMAETIEEPAAAELEPDEVPEPVPVVAAAAEPTAASFESFVEEESPDELVEEQSASADLEEETVASAEGFATEPEFIDDLSTADQPAEPEVVEEEEAAVYDMSVEQEIETLSEAELVSEPDAEMADVLNLIDEEPVELLSEAELAADEELPLEEIGEVDFYLQQELFEQARLKLSGLIERFPGNPDLEARIRQLDATPAAAERPAAFSRDEIESELLSAIPDDDEDFTFTAPPPAPAPLSPSAAAAEQSLFADEENFFDLAAELESELAEEEEAIALSEEEQSLEEIFKEFKRGVEQQLDSEDYDTHYNLGIAYKEMGLIDEAIAEFQLSSKDPKRAVECASMLGLCFLEKGMPQLAIKWYRKGLEMPEISEEEHIGLLFDLGAAYQEVGDTDNAQKAFMEVYGMNSTYRDVLGRIKQVQDARQ
jgi:pilus assembly protein FimV